MQRAKDCPHSSKGTSFRYDGQSNSFSEGFSSLLPTQETLVKATTESIVPADWNGIISSVELATERAEMTFCNQRLLAASRRFSVFGEMKAQKLALWMQNNTFALDASLKKSIGSKLGFLRGNQESNRRKFEIHDRSWRVKTI